MEGRERMRYTNKLVITIAVMVAICFYNIATMLTSSCLAEIVSAGDAIHEYQQLLPCPSVSLSSLLETQEQIDATKALRLWFLRENLLTCDWYDSLWNHNSIILAEPYIIKSETPSENEKILYCASAISSYSLFTNNNGSLFLAEGKDECGLFRLYFSKESGRWEPNRVHILSDMSEELFAGAGIGTEGFPGLSPSLSKLIPNWGFSTDHIAQKYLDNIGISAEIITW